MGDSSPETACRVKLLVAQVLLDHGLLHASFDICCGLMEQEHYKPAWKLCYRVFHTALKADLMGVGVPPPTAQAGAGSDEVQGDKENTGAAVGPGITSQSAVTAARERKLSEVSEAGLDEKHVDPVVDLAPDGTAGGPPAAEPATKSGGLWIARLEPLSSSLRSKLSNTLKQSSKLQRLKTKLQGSELLSNSVTTLARWSTKLRSSGSALAALSTSLIPETLTALVGAGANSDVALEPDQQQRLIVHALWACNGRQLDAVLHAWKTLMTRVIYASDADQAPASARDLLEHVLQRQAEHDQLHFLKNGKRRRHGKSADAAEHKKSSSISAGIEHSEAAQPGVAQQVDVKQSTLARAVSEADSLPDGLFEHEHDQGTEHDDSDSDDGEDDHLHHALPFTAASSGVFGFAHSPAVSFVDERAAQLAPWFTALKSIMAHVPPALASVQTLNRQSSAMGDAESDTLIMSVLSSVSCWST